MLLGQISLQLAQPANATFSPIMHLQSTLPSNLDVAVNVLWTLSLFSSLTSALVANLVQQWAQEYLAYSRCHPIPSTRARIRAYLFNGMTQHRLDLVISAIPLPLHLGLLLFGAGLITCFFSLNNVVAYTALGAYSIVGASYILLSVLPLIDLSSPFKTPISNFLWRTVQLVQLTVLSLIQSIASFISYDSIFIRFRLPEVIRACRERYRAGIARGIEQNIETRRSIIDADSLRLVVLSLQTDAELEPFIGAIPQFLDSESQNYSQYNIGLLLEDPDVRLGWSIGRLLQTCASSFCALEPHVRKGRALTCLRAIWCITERFANVSMLYWDTLFGAETADSLATLGNDYDPTVALIARCSAALAARSCLRELSDVSAWMQTRGPHWSKRALQLINLISKVSGVTLLAEPKTAARDGPLLVLGAFLKGAPHGATRMDNDVSFMLDTTVKHLVDGLRAGEASPNAQKRFSEIFSNGTYDLWRQYLGPAAFQALHGAVDALRQDLAPRMPDDWVDGGFPGPQERLVSEVMVPQNQRCPVGASYNRWSHDSSVTAFSGGTTTPSSCGNVPIHPHKSECPLKTVVESPSSPRPYDRVA